jgi:hypothetical protein
VISEKHFFVGWQREILSEAANYVLEAQKEISSDQR